MSDISFDCPHCGNQIIVDERGIGMEVSCPHCSGMIVIAAPVPPAGGEDPSQSPAAAGEAETDCRIVRNTHFVQPMWSLEIRMADRALDRLRGQSSCVLARATVGERDTRVITAEDVVKQISTFGRYECLFKDRRQAQRFLDEIQNTLLALQEEQPGE